MTPTPRLRALLATLTCALLGFAAPASAATITDPPNDARDGDPGHEITQFDWTYDPAAGTAAGTVTVAGQAATDAFVFMLIGTPGSDGTCTTSDAVALGGYLDAARGDGQWLGFTGGEANGQEGTAKRSDGAVTTGFTATDARLTGKGWSCAVVRLANPASTSEVYDEASAPVAAQPTPTPTPTPTPAPQPTPAPTPAPAPQLRATLAGVPAKVKKGKRFRPTLTIANRGTAASKAVTVRFKRARGLSVRPRTIKVKGLAPGKAKRVRLKVTLTGKARRSTPLVVSAKGGGLTATARKTLRLKAKPKPRPKPKPTPAKGGLPGTFWWWNDFTSYEPFDVYSLRFYGNGYASYRLPDDGQSVPDRCDSVTAVPDKDGEFGPGCVKWDLKGTRLTFSDPRFTGTYENGKLSIRDAEKTFDVDKLAEPKAGKRFNFSYKNIETTGFCGLPGTYCSVQKSYLTLQDDGQFGLQEESTSTLDTGGSFTYAGSFPPESRGTYEVLDGYRIKLAYADGKTEVVPFGLVDGTSAVDKEVRVVLGRLPFWVENDDG